MLAHLLESTICAAAIWLATLTLRSNRARVRHALWMAASVKFLIPFSLLVALGSRAVPPPAPPVPVPQMRVVLVDLPSAAPTISSSAIAAPPAPAHRDWQAPVCWGLWALGCMAVLVRWQRRWRMAAAALREAGPWSAPLPAPVPVRSSPWAVEPGVFGIFRPVLLLPQGIEERLSAEQLHAVLAHELCHIRHRDNLAAAVHMLVEALFWFHPLIWWMGARLVVERERACDEEVLQYGSDRAVYAQSILRVCEFCLESPVPCVSGITGADLNERVRGIMSGRVCGQLELRKKLLLAAMGAAALAVPLAIGWMHPARIHAQNQQTAPALRFEAASLKLADDQRIIETRPKRPIGRFRWKTQLSYLVNYAYHIEWWRMPDFPGQEKIYEVEATADPRAGEDQLRLMLQSLLVERFKLAVHLETRQGVDGYALTAAKDGPKMEGVKPDDPPADPDKADEFVAATLPTRTTVHVKAHHATMERFSESLQRLLETAVLDHTGLTGQYNFEFDFARPEEDPHDYTGVISAVKQLGLRLEKYKGPVDFLVIDHIEKTPIGN